MPGLNRRSVFAAIALPLLFLAMSGIGRAAGTVTNCTTFGPGAGTLEAALTGGGTVTFACSGTIIVTTIGIASGTTSIDATGQSVTLSGDHANAVFGVAAGATLNLTNLTISNGSNSISGGGIENLGIVTVTNCTFSGNSSERGGGIENFGALTVTNSIFSDNIGSAGGGIDNNDGILTVTNSTFSDNTAFNGGGINNLGSLKITTSAFSGNTGGGIENFGSETVTNSTFSDNSVHGSGGGIENLGIVTVTNCTFSGNIVGDGGGGGINNESGGTATLKSTVLGAESSGGNCGGAITDAGFNISDDDSCGFTEAPTPGGTSINNSTTLNLDPAGPQNNGGPTQTIALELNSQAVGFDKDCTDQAMPPATILTDQRGFPRPNSPTQCDSGAFELQTGRLQVQSSGERVQIARGATPNTDLVNMAFSFVDLGSPVVDDATVALNCDAGNDALNGVGVDLFSGTCDDLGSGGLLLDLAPWVIHTVAHVNYGTIFQSSPTVPSPETVSATIVQLLTPLDSCGEWSLNVEVAGLDTAALNLGGTNPFALVVQDADKNVGCFNVTNAIVGSQIDPPKRTVRRDVRR